MLSWNKELRPNLTPPTMTTMQLHEAFDRCCIDFVLLRKQILLSRKTIETFQDNIYPNTVDPAFASPAQTIATYRKIVGGNILHAFGHPQVATCCNMLGVGNRTSAHVRAQHCCTKRQLSSGFQCVFLYNQIQTNLLPDYSVYLWTVITTKPKPK